MIVNQIFKIMITLSEMQNFQNNPLLVVNN